MRIIASLVILASLVIIASLVRIIASIEKRLLRVDYLVNQPLLRSQTEVHGFVVFWGDLFLHQTS